MTVSAPPGMPPGMEAPPGAVSPKQEEKPAKRFSFTSGQVFMPKRVVGYGPGGSGKSELFAQMPDPVFVDLEGNTGHLGMIQKRLGPDQVPDWETMVELIKSPTAREGKSFVIDTTTQAQDLARKYVIRNVPDAKGNRVERLEDYGYGAGQKHMLETFSEMLVALEELQRDGVHIGLVAHEVRQTMKNPSGEDHPRYTLALLDSPNTSVMERVFQWASDVFFINVDAYVSKDGKAQAGDSRTIYLREQAWCRAKVHPYTEVPSTWPFEQGKGEEFWEMLGCK